jgi:hypothetical protein
MSNINERLTKLAMDAAALTEELKQSGSNVTIDLEIKRAERFEAADAAVEPEVVTEESGSKEEAEKMEGDPDKSEERHDEAESASTKEAMPLEAAEPVLQPKIETPPDGAEEEAARMEDQEHQDNEDVNDADEDTETELNSTNETEAAEDMSEGLGKVTDEYTDDKSDQKEATDEHSAIETQRGSLKYYAPNKLHNPVGVKVAESLIAGNIKAASGYLKLHNHMNKTATLRASGFKKLSTYLDSHPDIKLLDRQVRSVAGNAASRRAAQGREEYKSGPQAVAEQVGV